MATTFGPIEGRLSVGINVSQSPATVTSSTASVTLTWTVYAKSDSYGFNDPQTMTMSNAMSDTANYTMVSGSGSDVTLQVWTDTQVVSTSYTGTVSRTLTASASGLFNGGTPSHSRTIAIPKRPYAVPTAPSGVSATRNSDAQATVNWTNNATAGGPYTSLTVNMRTFTGSTWSAWSLAGSPTSTATSFIKTGLVANRIYQFQIRSNNTSGSSSYVSTANVAMTPAAPTNVVSSLDPSGTTTTTTWTNNAYIDAGVTYTIQRSVAGGAYANVATGIAEGTLTWTDPTPGGGTNSYRVAAVQSSGALTSAYTTGNTVSTVVPPLAPTLLVPNGTAIDLTQNQTLSWKHNPGGDGAAQTHYTLEVSNNAGSTWTALVATDVLSSVSSRTITGGTLANGVSYLWRVKTEGIVSGGYGPFSTNATFTGSGTPTATLSAPPATVNFLPLVTTWAYNQDQGSPQSEWEAVLYASNGTTVLQTLTGSGTTTSATFDYALVNGTSYVVKVRVRSAAGIWSGQASQSFSFDLLPPAPGALEIEQQPCTGTVSLHVTAPFELRRNWFSNPSFGTNTTSWASARGTLTRTVGTSVAGAAHGAYVSTDASTAGGNYTQSEFVPSAPGEVATVSTYIKATTTAMDYTVTLHWYNAAAYISAVSSSVTAVSTGAYTRISVSGTAPALTTRFRMQINPILAVPVSSGYVFDASLAEKTLTLGSYFDGDTVTDATYSYEWSGTGHASHSIATPPDTVAAMSANIDRRVNGGEWVTLTTELPIPSDFIDLLPVTRGINEYRVTTVSASPSYNEGQPYIVEMTSNMLVFLNYGDAFDKVLRFKGEPDITEVTGRAKQLRSFLGRKKPVQFLGANTSREISASGILNYGDAGLGHYVNNCETDPDCRLDSPPEDWNTAGLEAETVVFRDFTGRRIFGMLSDVDTSNILFPVRASISFNVTETDYVERYGVVDIVDPLNLIDEESSSFEGGTVGSWGTGWFGAAGTVAIASSTTRATVGARSMEVTRITAGAELCGPQYGVVNLDPTKTYRITARVWVPSASAHVRMNDPFGGTPSANSTLKDQWQTISIDVTNKTTTYLCLRNATASVAGEKFWVDDFKSWEL